MPPFAEFDYIMYGMVTNLNELATGTATNRGWSPENRQNPQKSGNFTGKSFWIYGGGNCFPQQKPETDTEIDRIISATKERQWDGVDFDDECSMNTSQVIKTMKILKQNKKATSFGFIAGYDYNHPGTKKGEKLTNKVNAIISSGYCDLLIHYCYAASMWNRKDITNNVRQALERSIAYGIPSHKIILALTTRGLTHWNLNYFLEQVVNLDLGGLFIWQYHKLSKAQRNTIKILLNKSQPQQATSKNTRHKRV